MPSDNHLASTRAVFDYSASEYVGAIGTEISSKSEAPLDRAVLDTFADSAAAQGQGIVLDIGCGPGRVAAYLASRGLETCGIDISTQMVEEARVAHPSLRFEEGSLTEVPFPDGSLIGAVYWYSIIATPPNHLREVWQELDRVLRPGGQVLVAFQAGQDEATERANAYRSGATLNLYPHSVRGVSSSLEAAGFNLEAEILRQPTLVYETTPQAMLLASKPELDPRS